MGLYIDLNNNNCSQNNTDDGKYQRMTAVLPLVLYPLMFRVLCSVQPRIPHIKYNLYLNSDDNNEEARIIKANDSKSFAGLVMEMEEPDFKDYVNRTSEIGIIYHCDQITHPFRKPCPGFLKTYDDEKGGVMVG